MFAEVNRNLPKLAAFLCQCLLKTNVLKLAVDSVNKPRFM